MTKTDDTSASYSRRSKDLDRVGLNVASQERDNVARAKSNGHTIPKSNTYVDNDVSASRFGKKVRTDWQRLRHDIEHGPVVNIYTLMLDRLLRLPGELEWLIDQAFVGNFSSIITDEDVLDLRTESGISRARAMAHAADMEVRKLSKRIRRAFNEKRNDGHKHCPTISLGWLGTRHGHVNDNGDTIHEWEAALIRDAAKRHLVGVSYNTLAQEWTNAGVLHPKEMHHARKANRKPIVKPWTATEVRYAITSPRNAGLLTHNGDVVGPLRDADGEPVTPILDDKTWRKLVAITERRKVGPRSVRRSGKWTGVVRCGGTMPDGTPCGSVMLYNTNHTARMFNCRALPGRRACGANGIMASYVEDVARKWLVEYANNVNAELRRKHIKSDADVERINGELKSLQRIEDETTEDRGTGAITRVQANKTLATVNARRAELNRQLESMGIATHDAFATWHGNGDALNEWLDSEACTAAEHRAVYLATDHFVFVVPHGTRGTKAMDHAKRVRVLEDHPNTKTRASRRRTA